MQNLTSFILLTITFWVSHSEKSNVAPGVYKSIHERDVEDVQEDQQTKSSNSTPTGIELPFQTLIHGVATLNCPAQCPPCPQCPSCSATTMSPGYKKYGDLGYYKFHSTPMTWWDAVATCEREGASLVVLNSQQEASLLIQLNNRRSEYLHVGFHDLFKSRVFYTLQDQPLEESGYSVWKAGEPNNVNERCGTFYQDGGLNDNTCSMNFLFACELV